MAWSATPRDDRPGRHERGGCCLSMTLVTTPASASSCWTAAPRAVAGPAHRMDRPGNVAADHLWLARLLRLRILLVVGQDGAYDASGIFGQSIAVIPDERLVIVVNSAGPSRGRRAIRGAQRLVNGVRAAAKGL